MNKEETRKALLAPDEALIALGFEGLTKDYHRDVAQAWVDSGYDYVINGPIKADNPQWYPVAIYKLPEPEQWDCGIDFGRMPSITTSTCPTEMYVSLEFYNECVKLIPLIRLNKLIEEKNKETGWVADWNDACQKKVHICFDEECKTYSWWGTCLFSRVGMEALNPECADEVLNMLNKGLVKGME